jgi:hypothetical protein
MSQLESLRELSIAKSYQKRKEKKEEKEEEKKKQ